jgi:hypothetical protein
MGAHYEELRRGMLCLRDALQERLSEDEQREVTELVDANEFGVALEFVLDALTEANRTLPRPAVAMVEKLALMMEMYPAILNRLPPDLIEES